MKEFYWQYFAATGSVEAFVLYKDNGEKAEERDVPEEDQAVQEPEFV